LEAACKDGLLSTFLSFTRSARYCAWSGRDSHRELGASERAIRLGSDSLHGIDLIRAIENNSSPGQAVYEPFSGSGTTIVAAEMTGRSCFAIEIDPAYVDVAVLRWQAFTGETAMLEGDGRSFAQVAAERHCEADKAAEVAH
jgi:hypothetical protein